MTTYDADMIERVAEAIYNVDPYAWSYNYDGGDWLPSAWNSDDIEEEDREKVRKQAVAALEAAGIHVADRPKRFPPSEYLSDVLRAHGWTSDDFARRSCLLPHVVDDILFNGRPITEPVADLIALALDTSPELWLNLQRAYDEGRNHDTD